MIKEITVDGRVYVDKEELRSLIKDYKKKFMAGTEEGFIEEDKGKRYASFFALSHLQAALLNDKEREEMYDRAKKRVERQKHHDAIVAITKGEDDSYEMEYFVKWIVIFRGTKREKRVPIFGDVPAFAMEFDDKEFAEATAEKIKKRFFNDEDTVMAVPYADIMTEAGRSLLMALFAPSDDKELDCSDCAFAACNCKDASMRCEDESGLCCGFVRVGEEDDV